MSSNRSPDSLAPLSQTRLEAFFLAAKASLEQHRAGVGQMVESYFDSMRKQLDLAREEIREHNLRHADEFNVFDYILPNENLLSDILRDLLDPKGKHGQGDSFLQLLMRNLKVPIPCGFQQVTVTREGRTTYHSLKPLRRIDILLDFPTFGVGIENKPWAQEQTEQVKDYLYHLGRQYGDNFLLVYLSGDGAPPKSVPVPELLRLEQHNKFRLLAYPTEILKWLGECLECCQAERVQWFLRDLSGFVRDSFGVAVTDWRRVG